MGYGSRLGAILKQGDSLFVTAERHSEKIVCAVPVVFKYDEGHSICVPAGIICDRECFLSSRTVRNFRNNMDDPYKLVGYINKKYMPFVTTVSGRYHL